MDTMQLLLFIVLGISTILLTIVGIQLIILLYEVRKALSNINKIVKGFDTIGTGLQQGLGEATGFLNGLKTVMKIVDLYNNRKEK